MFAKSVEPAFVSKTENRFCRFCLTSLMGMKRYGGQYSSSLSHLPTESTDNAWSLDSLQLMGTGEAGNLCHDQGFEPQPLA